MSSKVDPSDNVLNVPSGNRDDEEITRLLNSSDVDKLRSLLDSTEVVHSIILCKFNGSESVLAATNERLVFCDNKFLSAETISISYPDIAAVIFNPELLSIGITIVHLGGSIHVDGVDKIHGMRFIDYLKDIVGDHYNSYSSNGRVLEYTNYKKYADEVATEI